MQTRTRRVTCLRRTMISSALGIRNRGSPSPPYRCTDVPVLPCGVRQPASPSKRLPKTAYEDYIAKSNSPATYDSVLIQHTGSRCDILQHWRMSATLKIACRSLQ